ncbi:MAG: group II intron maturase-specific domain-containing protein, partial [Pseudomonadota bacterium]|nr:group II intron maturase-specific domain-containing protein [Pseudomonadota bacterium]
LRGWANYFHYRNSSVVMSKVRQHAEDRLRTHLMKRHKIRNRKAALCRFPRRDLYERHGLDKPPMVAGWRAAHASV